MSVSRVTRAGARVAALVAVAGACAAPPPSGEPVRVTIPRGEHTAIDYGQFLPVTPGEPVVARTVEVAGGFNRLTLMHVVVTITPGAYRIRSVAPDGTEFVTGSTAGEEWLFRFYEATDPDGEWELEDLVGGVGSTYSMGIAYHQYDIRLPDGARRADHSHPVIR